jgi:protoporphyrin/coproporphyrin ferrochelatase
MQGVLLVNLGSPQSPEVKDVKAYLNQFLMDGNVIDIPYLLRLFLVRGIIVPKRAANSSKLYQKIWTDEGSPLIVNSERVVDKVKSKISIPLALAMRYGEPSIDTGLEELDEAGIDDVLVVPLYPQYAMSTTQTVIDEVEKIRKKKFPQMSTTYLPPFYDNSEYIKVLASSVKEELKDQKPDHLLFSYHGLPERHLKKADPTGIHCLSSGDCCTTPNEAHATCYRHQCFKTTEMVVDNLGVKEDAYSVSFQSRLGKDPWMQPYTTDKVKHLAKDGIKNLAVVTPAFVSDCLETIEEIGIEAKEDFLNSGGEHFTRIECINDSEDWADLLASWLKQPDLFGKVY